MTQNMLQQHRSGVVLRGHTPFLQNGVWPHETTSGEEEDERRERREGELRERVREEVGRGEGQQYWFLQFAYPLYHEPAICTLKGSKGVPLKGDPSAFHAFFKISWAF